MAVKSPDPSLQDERHPGGVPARQPAEAFRRLRARRGRLARGRRGRADRGQAQVLRRRGGQRPGISGATLTPSPGLSLLVLNLSTVYREVLMDFTPEMEVLYMLFERCNTKNRK